MKDFIADLHVHSLYSRSTSKKSNLENFAIVGADKGLDLITTGDFTHPAWIKELKQKLVEYKPGIYKLKEKIEPVNHNDPNKIQFIFTTEISSIYKKNGAVRKIHSIIFAPDFDSIDKINKKLDSIGNIKSDGRPILGLDVKHLLEITLEASERAFLVPAHIWTPWFSVLGDKSGFDSVEEAFEDLTPYIFAVETGLSSDPAMNWRLSSLDNFTLLSNSDSHSPEKLARNANVFEKEMDFDELKQSIKTRQGFKSTIEFFPEQGKYHFDGHRNCSIRLDPGETGKLDSICPVCGKKLTIGVMHRVEELANRPRGYKPENRKPYESIIPLKDIISEIKGVGQASKSVQKIYNHCLQKFGNELNLLRKAEIKDIEKEIDPVLSEAIKRMRNSEVKTEAGFDGEYGRIYLFEKGELDSFSGQSELFERKISKRKNTRNKTYTVEKRIKEIDKLEKQQAYTKEQNEIINKTGHIKVVSGPGTGKTHTLIGRIKRLIDIGINPDKILVLTFTHKTKVELEQRINYAINQRGITINTFHGFGYKVLLDNKFSSILIDNNRSTEIIKEITGFTKNQADNTFSALSFYRQTGNYPKNFELENSNEILRKYIDYKNENSLIDMDDLIVLPPGFLNQNPDAIKYKYVLVDEFQDINNAQYQMLKPVFNNAEEIFVIGDPDQAIYSFRGSDMRYFNELENDFDNVHPLFLNKSFRCPAEIIRAASTLISKNNSGYDRSLISAISEKGSVYYHKAKNAFDEAAFIANKVKSLVGAFELTGDESKDENVHAFNEIAILLRSRILQPKIEKALEKQGIPYSTSESKEFESNAAKSLFSRLQDYVEYGVAARLIFDEIDITVDKFNENPSEAVKLLIESNYTDGILEWEKSVFISSAKVSANIKDLLFNVKIALNNWSAHPAAQKVSLITLHAAKGLEFRTVFIPGCEQGIIPFELKKDNVNDIEEERRLFYVGLTRGEQSVYLTGAGERQIYGETKELPVSKFIKELGKIEKVKSLKNKPVKKDKPVQFNLFE